MKQIKIKALSMLMAAVMVFAMAPLGTGIAFAAEDDEGQPVVTNEEASVADEELPAEEEEVTEEEVVGEEAPEAAVNEEPAVKAAGDDETAAEYKLWIGGVQVTSETTSGEGWTYSGNGTKGTLTLNNANLTEAEESQSVIDFQGIDLTLDLVGTSVIGNESVNAITADADSKLTIIGSGTLTAIGDTCAIMADKLEIKSGTVSAEAASTWGTIEAKELTISGGAVTATSTDVGSGIVTQGDILISGGSVNAISSGYGGGICIFADEDKSEATTLRITGGTVNVTVKETRGSAMRANDCDIIISGGTVKAVSESIYGMAISTVIEESLWRGGSVTITGGADVTAETAGSEAVMITDGGENNSNLTVDNATFNVKGTILSYGNVMIKDAKVTQEGYWGIIGEIITIRNTGKGQYTTRVEATATGEEPSNIRPSGGEVQTAADATDFPAVLGMNAINIKDDLKIVEPKDGVVKKIEMPYLDTITGTGYTVCNKTKVAPHVIIEPVKTNPQKNTVKQVFLAKAKAKGKKALKIDWMKYQGAGGYDIFMCDCDNGAEKHTQKLIKTIKGNKTFAWTKKGLKAKKKYKLYVKAWKMQNGKKTYLAMSNTMHVFTSGKMGKYTNPKSVTVSTKNVSLTAGKSYKIKAKVNKLKKSKKLMPATHTKVLRYISSNPGVATVSGAGVITAKAKGKCTVYVFAANGARQAVTVNVR